MAEAVGVLEEPHGRRTARQRARKGRRLKVLHVVDTLGMGGAETWLMELVRLAARDPAAPQIDILATSGNRGLFDDEAEALGVRIHYLRFGRRSLPRFAAGFRRVLRSGQYDVLHDHQDYAAGWHMLIAAGVLPAVRVVHVHNPWIHISSNYGVSASRRLAARLGKALVHRFASHVTGTSAEVLRVYGFDANGRGPQVRVVHCGIDVGKFNGAPEADRASVLAEFGWAPDARIVLFAGRLDRALAFKDPQNHKNSWLAMHIAKAALERDPALRLLMAGAGDAQRAQMQQHIDEWGLSQQLKLIGVREDLPRLMRAADALLFPSAQEGLGMVAVEAQATGVPVVASTAVPRECIVCPELYRAVDLDEPLSTWADALLGALVDRGISSVEAGEAVRASAFSVENSAAALMDVYAG